MRKNSLINYQENIIDNIRDADFKVVIAMCITCLAIEAIKSKTPLDFSINKEGLSLKLN